ncbi:MAG: type II secretion system F family protein [Candidatus Methanomethylophilaceae archaeon]
MLEKTYELIKNEPGRYLLYVVAVTLLLGTVIPALVLSLVDLGTPGLSLYLVMLSPGLVVFLAAITPFLQVGMERRRVNQIMPLFVTHMASMVTSGLPLEKVFGYVAEMRDYGVIAQNCGQIQNLVVNYGMTVSEACRFVGKDIKNDMERDFFIRLAHAIDVGDEMEVFFNYEQETIMDEFQLNAESTLKNMDFVKEIYVALIVSMTFLVVFVAIIPLVGGGVNEMILLGITFAFLVLEVMFLLISVFVMPTDRIWYPWSTKFSKNMVTGTDRLLIYVVVLNVVALLVLGAYVLLAGIDLRLAVPIVSTPLLISGLLIHREEQRINNRDNIYGSFIRALGRSMEASSASLPASVRQISQHKFGYLSAAVEKLSKRLDTNIDPDQSWDNFIAETESNFIDKFTRMYIDTTGHGSSPERTSYFISKNMNKFLANRKKRNVFVSSMVGVSYGTMVALAATMWIMYAIIDYVGVLVQTMYGGMASGGAASVFMGTIINPSYDLSVLSLAVIAILSIHALVSSLNINSMKGGHWFGGALHFSGLIWVGMTCTYLVDIFIGMIMT